MTSERKAGQRSAGVRFRTTLRQAQGKSATGILIPAEAIERLGHGKCPQVRVTVNGYEYRTTVGVMGGQAMVGVSAAIRGEAGLAAGDEIDVQLVVDETPRSVEVPADFAAALKAAGVRRFFDGLANSLQRYHVDLIAGAKTAETRERRVQKAVQLFQAGRKR